MASEKIEIESAEVELAGSPRPLQPCVGDKLQRIRMHGVKGARPRCRCPKTRYQLLREKALL